MSIWVLKSLLISSICLLQLFSPWLIVHGVGRDWTQHITQYYGLVCLFSFEVSESRGTASRYPCLHSQMMQITWYWTWTWCCKWKRILEVLGRLRILCMWGEWNNYNWRVDGVEGENKKATVFFSISHKEVESIFPLLESGLGYLTCFG